MACVSLSGMPGEVAINKETARDRTVDKEGKNFCFRPSLAVGAASY